MVSSSASVSDMQREHQKSCLKGLAFMFAANTNTAIPTTRNPPCINGSSLEFVYSLPCYFPRSDFNHYTAANPLLLLLHSAINVHNCPFPLHLRSQQLHFCCDTTCNNRLKRTHLHKVIKTATLQVHFCLPRPNLLPAQFKYMVGQKKKEKKTKADFNLHHKYNESTCL